MIWHTLTNDQLRRVADIMLERTSPDSKVALAMWRLIRQAADSDGVKLLPLPFAAELDDALDDPTIVAQLEAA